MRSGAFAGENLQFLRDDPITELSSGQRHREGKPE